MWERYTWRRKRLSWTILQSLGKFKVFNVYGAITQQKKILSCMTGPVVSIKSFISSHELNHFEFHEYFLEIKAEYLDLPYQAVVQWLSGDSLFFWAQGQYWNFSELVGLLSIVIIKHLVVL